MSRSQVLALRRLERWHLPVLFLSRAYLERDAHAVRQDGRGMKHTRKRLSRVAFYLHLWLGVIATVSLIGISVTGVLLNHKRGLGLMPEVAHEATAQFGEAITLEHIAYAALEAAPAASRGEWKRRPYDVEPSDGRDVRPRKGGKSEVTRQGIHGDDRRHCNGKGDPRRTSWRCFSREAAFR